MKKKIVIIFLMSLLVFGFGFDGFAKKQKVSKEEKAAAKAAKKEAGIEEVLGPNSNWKPLVFANIRKGMTCDEVQPFFKGLNCADPSPFKSVSKGLGTVSEYKFYFQNNRLYSVTIIFGTRLFDEKSFTEALMNVAQRKWGTIQDPQKIQWRNHDYNTVNLTYNKTQWELEFQMPTFDPGDVDIESFNDENLRAEIKNFLGGTENCMPTYFTQFRYRMPWEEVKNSFPDLEYDPAQSMNYIDVSTPGHALIAGLKLRFNSGLLEHVTAVLHWQIPRDSFKTISFEVMKEKYGADVKDEDAVIDRIMVYTKDCGYVTREWSTDHWQFDMTLPKTGGGKVTGAKTPAAKAPAASTSKTSTTPAFNIVGNWKLVAARQGTKTENMTEGPQRTLEFSSDQQIFMKEDGKVVMSNYFKVSNQYIYFTSGKDGKTVKQFGTIVSQEGSKLVLKFAGQTIEMIFEKM